MKKREPHSLQQAFTFDENGTKEVSDQIMNAYSSGVIDQPKPTANSEETESVAETFE